MGVAGGRVMRPAHLRCSQAEACAPTPLHLLQLGKGDDVKVLAVPLVASTWWVLGLEAEGSKAITPPLK